LNATRSNALSPGGKDGGRIVLASITPALP
jgi:hypothetical protein